MTGLHSRHPAGGPGHRRDSKIRAAGGLPAALIRPGPVNICLCHLLVVSLVLAPLALAFAIRHAEPGGRRLASHYLYLRTSFAILVIGTGLGSLMILLGAPLSSLLMLAGLGLIAATLALTLARCGNGFCRALLGLPLRNPKSYLV